MRDVDRRSVLSALAGGAVGAGLVTRGSSPDRIEARSTRPMMGTLVTVAAVTPSRERERAEAGIDAAFAEMARLTDVFSRHDPEAQVARLNAAGALADPAPELVSVLETCRRLHAGTDGAFDPTVLPALSGDGRSQSAGIDAIRIEDGTVRTTTPITLDGVAKGYIVDRGCATLRRWVDEGLIEAGGDIRVFGGTDDRWRIGVHDPRGEGALSRIRLRNGAVATSGSYEVSAGSGVEAGGDRIVRAGTGRAPDEDVAVTVVSRAADRADALATAAFALDDDTAASVLERFDAAGLFVPTGGEPIRTDSWPRIVREAGSR